MAQTRKQLNNQLATANAQLAVHNHQTRRTLNERVRNAECRVKELEQQLLNQAVSMKNAQETHNKLLASTNETILALAARVTELEAQVLSSDSEE